jgi:hypothetical protein
LKCASYFMATKPHVYRVLVTIEANTVYVLHIRHGRRKRLT